MAQWAERYERRGMRRQMSLDRSDSIRPPITKARQVEANVDWPSMNAHSFSLIDPDSGDFWFIPGYSLVGGGDRVRP